MKIIICALICCLWNYEAYPSSVGFFYEPCSNQLIPSQVTICEYARSLLDLGFNEEDIISACESKASEIVDAEVSAYCLEREYHDLQYYYTAAMDGKAQENINALTCIYEYCSDKKRSSETRLRLVGLQEGEYIDRKVFLTGKAFNFLNNSWAEKTSCWFKPFGFSKLLADHSSFERAIEALSARLGKMPADVEAGLRSRCPLAFERQE